MKNKTLNWFFTNDDTLVKKIEYDKKITFASNEKLGNFFNGFQRTNLQEESKHVYKLNSRISQYLLHNLFLSNRGRQLVAQKPLWLPNRFYTKLVP